MLQSFATYSFHPFIIKSKRGFQKKYLPIFLAKQFLGVFNLATIAPPPPHTPSFSLFLIERKLEKKYSTL